MERKDVVSSMIRSIGHDVENSILEIEFKSGAVWHYFDVAEHTWHEFSGAESHGKYFLANIKGHYREGQVA